MAKRLKFIEVTFRIPACLVAPFIRFVLLYRRIRYGYPFRRIPLTRGKFAIVDPEDYPRLSRCKWHAVKHKAARTWYAKRGRRRSTDKSGFVHLLHRQVIKVPPDMVIDHIHHNGLDNRKANLRIATPAQNSRNTRKRTTKTGSKYKGVTWQKHIRKWRARITLNGKRISLGCFHTEIQAAKAYDRAARKYHGEFAATNFQF